MVDPIVHFEIPADNTTRAKKFYETVFGWKITYMKEMDYFTIKAKDAKGNGIDGGMMKRKMPGQPLLNYVFVASIDASLKKAVANGAKVCMQKMQIGEMGWIAAFSDPEGNMMGLHQVNPAFMKKHEAAARAAAKKAPAKKPVKKDAKKKKQ